MSRWLETISAVEDRTLDGIRSIQDVAVDTTKTLVETARPYVPSVQVPFASLLPEPETLVNHAYDLASRLFDQNRHFVESLTHTLAPLTPSGSTGKPAKKAAAKPKTSRPTHSSDDSSF